MTSVKIAFVLDCTGSMEAWIQAAKNKIREIVNATQAEHPDTAIEVGLLGYRDYDDEERFIVVDFTTPENVIRRLWSVSAEGGEDEAEDVAHALQQMLGMSWCDADIRMVFHIADAPAHGAMFHRSSISDRFPQGDPEGVDPRNLMKTMSDLAFVYTFVKITSATDTMLDVFHNSWVGPGVFQVIDLTPQALGRGRGLQMFSPSVTRAVSQAIDRYTSSQDK